LSILDSNRLDKLAVLTIIGIATVAPNTSIFSQFRSIQFLVRAVVVALTLSVSGSTAFGQEIKPEIDEAELLLDPDPAIEAKVPGRNSIPKTLAIVSDGDS